MSDTGRDSSSPSASPESPADYVMVDTLAPAGSGTSPALKAEGGASPKRTTENPEAGGMGTGAGANPQKQTKRRAARACVSCRARKVRCDVVENSPCGNCKWDGVKCEVQESRRRKKTYHTPMVGSAMAGGGPELLRNRGVGLGVSMPPPQLRMATSEYGRQGSITDVVGGAGLMGSLEVPPHPLLYQQRSLSFVPDSTPQLPRVGDGTGGVSWNGPTFGANPGYSQHEAFPPSVEARRIIQFPSYIKPLPAKLSQIDIDFLYQKGALLIPTSKLQKALLKAYVEFVHPYMPLLALNDVLRILEGREQTPTAKISLLLYQAVMFVAVAFVDLKHLQAEEYPSRKAARKAFFNRVRLLYDFDVEAERHVLVQALLLMTYWYETPDDQKDTWHWMGVAISLAHTIGLHRDPANLKTIDSQKRKLFKRIWWSCFMRDRLIALGMRRPTRIQDEDFDVPMLEEADFEIEAVPEENQFLGPDCKFIRDTSMQRQLALMCIEKAKLCVLISRILKAQYSILSRDGMRPDNTTDSTMMMYPNKTSDNVERVQRLDFDLQEWLRNLPECCRFQPVTEAEVANGNATVALHRTLLHMVYRATVAALHRPEYLPPSPTIGSAPQEIARQRVHESARLVITMGYQLRQFKLDRYLPTTGVTVVLPAMIIHLLEMKNNDPVGCHDSTQRFQQGMEVLGQLQQSYAAADFASRFLEAVCHKLELGSGVNFASQGQKIHTSGESNGALGTIGTMSNPALVGPSISTVPLPDHTEFPGSTEINMSYHHQNPLTRDFMMGSVPDGSLTPPSSDKGSDQFGNISPGNNLSAAAAQATATMCPQTELWEGYSMSNQQQLSMDSDLEVSQWLQFPAEGVSNSDEVMIDCMLSNNEPAGDVGGHSYDWTKPQAPQQQHARQRTQSQTLLQFPHDLSELETMNLGSAGPAA